MIARVCGVIAMALLASTGCFLDEKKPAMGSRNVSMPDRGSVPQGSIETATRIDSLGRQILGANPELGIRPMFLSIGSPNLTVFHKGTTELYVSDGVCNKCKTDAELAAVLCSELGKMVAESQTKSVRNPMDRDPPFSPSVGSDVVGGDRDPDRTRLAEQAMWEKKNPRAASAPNFPTPDADDLSRKYLANAGFSGDDLSKVAPLLRRAEANPTFESQLNGGRNSGLGMPTSP